MKRATKFVIGKSYLIYDKSSEKKSRCRIICIDRKGDYPIVALSVVNDTELVYSFDVNGDCPMPTRFLMEDENVTPPTKDTPIDAPVWVKFGFDEKIIVGNQDIFMKSRIVVFWCVFFLMGFHHILLVKCLARLCQ